MQLNNSEPHFVGSGLNNIFHWKAHIVFKSLFLVLDFWEKWYVACKYFTRLCYFSRQTIYINKKYRLLHFATMKFFCLKQLFVGVLLSNLSTNLKRIRSVLWDCNWKSKPSCWTLSKAFEVSRKTPLIRRLLLQD